MSAARSFTVWRLLILTVAMTIRRPNLGDVLAELLPHETLFAAAVR